MTGYVAADQIAKGFVSLEDEVLISENCWKKGGSKMFIREGTKVLFSDLSKGWSYNLVMTLVVLLQST